VVTVVNTKVLELLISGFDILTEIMKIIYFLGPEKSTKNLKNQYQYLCLKSRPRKQSYLLFGIVALTLKIFSF